MNANRFSIFLPCNLAFLAIGLILACTAIPAHGQDSVKSAAKSIVDKIHPFLKDKRMTNVSVGGFNGVAGTSTGTEVQKKLADIIEVTDGLKLDPISPDVEIRGRIERVNFSNGLGVKLVAQLFDANGQPIGQFAGQSNEVSETVFGQEAVPRLLGITSNSAGEDKNGRNKKFADDSKQDPVFFKGNEIFSEEGSLYSIQVEVKSGSYAAVKPIKRGRRGNAFAEIPKNKIFAVRLNNYSSAPVAVNLTIDGISTFAFSEIRNDENYWIIPAAVKAASGELTPGTGLVRGWDTNDSKSVEFKTVDYPKTAAAKLKIAPNESIGQICAQFSLTREPSSGERGGGFGETIDDKKKAVNLVAAALQSTIHVRYER